MSVLSEKEKMLAGEEYFPSNKVLQQDRLQAKIRCHAFNTSDPTRHKTALKEMRSLFGSASYFWLEPSFNCDYGYNIHLGKNFYTNFGVVILDAAPVRIGDDVLLAPQVLISTATHPLDPIKRKKGIETAHPITIGNGVWVGMGAKILPGVTIGDNAVIGAGAVVNKDVASNTVVAGVPAAFIKQI